MLRNGAGGADHKGTWMEACWRMEISLYLGWGSIYYKIVYVFQDSQNYTLKRVNFTVYELILKKKSKHVVAFYVENEWFSFCSHISAKALHSMLLWISPVSRGVKIRWLHCFGRESHLHGKGQGGTWPENSNTSPLFVVLVQGSTRCAPGAK